MSPDRVATAVVRWVRLYTSGLPREVAQRRIEELRADVHDQIIHDRSLGLADRRVARRVASRMIRGAAADMVWRAHAGRTGHTTASQEHRMDTATRTRSVARIGAFVAAVLALPLIGTVISDDFDWGIADFILAGILLGTIGVCVEAAIRRAGNLWIAVAVACLGVAAAVAGELDDAPGLVLLGATLVAAAVAIVARRHVRSAS